MAMETYDYFLYANFSLSFNSPYMESYFRHREEKNPRPRDFKFSKYRVLEYKYISRILIITVLNVGNHTFHLAPCPTRMELETT